MDRIQRGAVHAGRLLTSVCLALTLAALSITLAGLLLRALVWALEPLGSR